MYSLDGRRRPVSPRPQVLVAQFRPTRPHPLEFLTFWLWHRYLLVAPWSDLRSDRRLLAGGIRSTPVSPTMSTPRSRGSPASTI
jgi:hypothetical protein